MEVVGQVLTKKEADKVKKPFATNKGEKWTLKKMKKYVDAGISEVHKDASLTEEINRTIKKV